MYCKKCGKEIKGKKDICEDCSKISETTVINTVAVSYEPKSKLTAGLLGLFLGSLGVHNFYLGYNGKAIAQLLITIIGGVITCGFSCIATSIWGIVEGILILTGSISTDGNGVPLKD